MARSSKGKKLVVAVLATTLFLVGAEVALGMFWPQATWDRTWNRPDGRTPTIPDELLPIALEPGARAALVRSEFDTVIRINSDGFRGPELDPDPGFRIVAAGDSFTYGWGVGEDQTYPRLLGQRLGEAEVVNAGFAAGLDPGTYYLWLEERGVHLDPDLVLVGLFVGNDIVFHGSVGGGLEWSEVDEAGLPLRITRGATEQVDDREQIQMLQRRYRYPFLRNSHVAQFLATHLRRMRPRQPEFNHWIYRQDEDPRVAESRARVEKVLLAAHEKSEARGVPLVVVLLPAREQVYAEQYDFSDFPYMEGAELDKPQAQLTRFFDERGIRYIDLLPAFRAARDGEPLYYPIDLHWTPAGTALAAEVVGDALLERGLVPERP